GRGAGRRCGPALTSGDRPAPGVAAPPGRPRGLTRAPEAGPGPGACTVPAERRRPARRTRPPPFPPRARRNQKEPVDLIERFTVIDGRRLAYPDSGGAGPTVLALHGHFSRGRAFAPLAQALSGRWRAGKSEAAALRFPAHPRCSRPAPKA